jgi:hypothetical protein
MKEVIRKEGGAIILYSKDEDKVLGRFPFGEGEKYTSEETAREAAEKREQQIQFFKTQEGQELLEQKKHSRKWHRCWEEVQKQGFSESRAAAICTWSLKKTGSVFEALGLKTNEVAISLDDANEMDGDGLLAAQMERDGIAAIIIDTDTWQIREIPEGSDEALAFVVEPELLTTEPDALPGVLVAAQESDTRELVETWDRSDTRAQIDESGNLSGIVLVEGLSANGNHYTLEALQSGPAIFAGKPIYADHPTRTEERDRPERSVRDLVGRLPESASDFYVEKITEGKFDGRHALHYRNAKLSETADWLRTLIREGIAGDQSINAEGKGRGEDNRFVVEAFTDAMSLDFVTKGAAGGRGFVEAEGSNHDGIAMDSLTFDQLCEARPDIIDTIGQRERRKAYGEKAELTELKQEVEVSTQLIQTLEARLRTLKKERRETDAEKILEAGLAGQPQTVQSYVRQLVESDVRRFVEQEEEVAVPAEPAGELAPVATDLERGDAPKLELPPDVGALPEEAQALWLEAYTAALPEGEETATIKAWAAVFDAGWKQDETGVWVKVEAAAIVPDEMAEPVMAEPMMTEAQLRGRVASLVHQRRAELATLTAAGQIRRMGGQADPQAQTKITEAQQKQAFLNMGLTEEQAEIARRGR